MSQKGTMMYYRLLSLIGLLLVLATPGWALEDSRGLTLQSAAVATGDGEMLSVSQFTAVSAQVTIATTATVTFEVTANGADWVSVTCTSIADTVGTLVSTATASGVYQCNVAGMTYFRARISAWTAGAVTVYGRATTAVLSKK